MFTEFITIGYSFLACGGLAKYQTVTDPPHFLACPIL